MMQLAEKDHLEMVLGWIREVSLAFIFIIKKFV